MTESGTTSALMDAAEVAFAERGVGHASLRAIMRAAGTDPAAVHYHFGSRDGLAEAVLDRVLAPLNERRVELLGALEDRARPLNASVEELLDALLRPDLEAAAAIGSRNPGAVRLVGTIYAQPSRFVKTSVERHFGRVARRFMPSLMTAVPHLTPGELSWRVRWHVFGVLGALLSDDEFTVDARSLEATLNPILTAAAGALTAPQPPRRSQ